MKIIAESWWLWLSLMVVWSMAPYRNSGPLWYHKLWISDLPREILASLLLISTVLNLINYICNS